MGEKSVLYQLNEKTAIITLNRPTVLNTMNSDLIGCLLDALRQAEQDRKVACIILTGAGKAFCAGGDLGFMETLQTAKERQEFIASVGQVPKTIMEMSKPVIAMVNGPAAGAGFNLALSCDLVYSAESAKFAQSFAKVGLIPDCGGLYFLPKLVGRHKAKELMFTARMLTAKDCFELGLINQVVADGALFEQVTGLAGALAESAPLSIAMTKRALNNEQSTLDEVLAYEAAGQPLLLGSGDYLEGVAAFKEKRPPKFTGK